MDDEITTPLDRLGESLLEAAQKDIAYVMLEQSMRRIRAAWMFSMAVGVILGFTIPHSAVSLVTVLVTLTLLAIAAWKWL